MKSWKVFLLSAVTLIAGNARANIVTELDSLFEARYPDSDEPGAQVLIARNGVPVYERYFGMSTLNPAAPVDSTTRFCIASISKQFTVVGLLTQVAQGKVRLTDPVSMYMPYSDPVWEKVQLWHLASHTSGIPDSRDRSDRNATVFATDSSSMAYFHNVTEADLRFTPGSAYDYLNPSFLILADVMAQQTGKPFTLSQQELIFEPAGMAHTYYFDPEAVVPEQSHGYIKTADGWKEYDYGEETFFATRPDGGIYTTARDILRWEEALRNNVILPENLREEAYKPHIKVSGSPWCDYQNYPDTYYGLGWYSEVKPGRQTKIFHTGDNGGYQAYVAKYPASGLVIIILENRNDRDRRAMTDEVEDILFRHGYTEL